MILVPFEPWHFKHVNLREFEETNLELYGTQEDINRMIEHYALLSCAFTAFKEESIIGIGGILPVWKGVGEAWIITSKDVNNNRLFTGRTIKRFLESLTKSMELHRIQCSVQADYEAANRLVQWLGFKNEGVMHAFGVNKKDYIRYARVILDDRN